MEHPSTSYQRFVLGTLSDAEGEGLEQRALEESEIFEELLMAEHELLEARARDQLSAQDRQRLDSLLATSPRLRQDLEVTRLLTREADLAASAQCFTGDDRRSPRIWLSEIWRRPAPMALAAAVLVLAIGLPIYQLRQQAADGHSGSVTTVVDEIYEVVLQPARLRDAEDPWRQESLEVPKAAERLKIYLEIDTNLEPTMLAARIVDRFSTEVWHGRGLSAQLHDWGRAVALELPVSPFLDEPYDVKLFGGEPPEEIDTYGFFLVRP